MKKTVGTASCRELGYELHFEWDEGTGDSVTGVDLFFELEGKGLSYILPHRKR